MSILKKNIRWQLPTICVAGLAIQVFALTQFADKPLTLALTDGLISISLLTLATWGILLLIDAYPTRVGIVVYAIIIATVFSLAVMYAAWLLSKILLEDHGAYLDWIWYSIPVRFIITWILCSWIATYTAQQKQTVTLETKFKQHADAASLLKDAELYKLRQQLQPHFMYNSLNSISALTMIAPEKAQQMIGKLSDFLRSSVRREGKERIAITDELQYIEAYLSIESVRFGDRLSVHIDKEFAADAEIPPFLVQPVLENAIKFGLYSRTGKVDIQMQIRLQHDMLLITVINPYDPEAMPPKGTGFGLEGIRRRLYLLFARADLLETKQNDQLYTTILKIPQTHVQSVTDR